MKKIHFPALLLFLCYLTGCIKEKETTDFNYSISDPGIIILEPGKSKTVELLVRGLSVDAQKVHLEIFGLPEHISASIDSATGTPGFFANVRYSADANASAGTYRFAVIGRSEKGREVSYPSNVQVIPYGSCMERFSGAVTVSQTKDTSQKVYQYKTNILWKASDSGLFYIENFANLHYKVKGYYDCTSQDITIPEQTFGATLIRGSGRIAADTFVILSSANDGSKYLRFRETFGK